MSDSVHDAHARFRFSVIGPLLSAPVAKGELRAAIAALADRTWKHPISGQPVRYAFSTIERWFYLARDAQNPVDVLRRAVRKDLGTLRSITDAFDETVRAQHRVQPHWSFQLHYDNVEVLVDADASLGPLPSYSSFVRFMRAGGLLRKKRLGYETDGQKRARQRLEQREVRSYEVDYVGGLWHLDFHVSKSVSVITPDGRRQKPELFAVLDDHSRLCCHSQFYLAENTENLVHGFSQALMKRGLPRELLNDNGSAMTSAEFTEGLDRLSISSENTLPHSPYQNGKQEHFWVQVEERLMAMLERVSHLTLDQLNTYLIAWVEGDYNRRPHSEIGNVTPLERFLESPDVLRPSPSAKRLRNVFRRQVHRTLRKSDLTISLDGTRFEIPARYRELRPITLRYARWDLSYVHLVDERANKLLAQIFPLDRSRNASGERRRLEAVSSTHDEPVPKSDELPPLLKKLVEDYAATGIPPSYLPKNERPKDTGEDHTDPHNEGAQ